MSECAPSWAHAFFIGNRSMKRVGSFFSRIWSTEIKIVEPKTSHSKKESFSPKQWTDPKSSLLKSKGTGTGQLLDSWESFPYFLSICYLPNICFFSLPLRKNFADLVINGHVTQTRPLGYKLQRYKFSRPVQRLPRDTSPLPRNRVVWG